MAIYTSILTGGSNDHETTSEEVNAFATDFANEGVTGTITNTGGVAPATGSFAVNAQGTPDATVAVSAGVAYATVTPTSQNSQTLRVRNTATANVTISANSSGSTKYDWIYISLSAANAANPAVAGDDVATLVASRSTSATSDDGTPPTYGYPLAVVTVANGFSTITNGNIQDIRNQVVLNQGLNTGTDGWTNAGETWTYASATTFTVAGVDVTAKYHQGTLIKLTQTSVKYFEVVSSSFSTNTTVTVRGLPSATTLANAAIVNPYYSYSKAPQGVNGGFAMGVFTTSATGNIATTGVGFTPKLVRFTWAPHASTTSFHAAGGGAMTPTYQFAYTHKANLSNVATKSSQVACLLTTSVTGSTEVVGVFVSMDADGFTINITTHTAAATFTWEAYG